MSQHRITLDEILGLVDNDKMSHLARMVQIRKIVVNAIKAESEAEVKRGPGRPPKDKDGAKAGDKVQDENPAAPGPTA